MDGHLMIRTRPWPMILCLLAGCSTNPLAGTLDLVAPGKLGTVTVQPYGGVGIPQGPIVPSAPLVPVVGAPVPLAPPTAVVPPPVPVPGGDLPAFPPLPPNPQR
jgi:hypothetical protein